MVPARKKSKTRSTSAKRSKKAAVVAVKKVNAAKKTPQQAPRQQVDSGWNQSTVTQKYFDVNVDVREKRIAARNARQA